MVIEWFYPREMRDILHDLRIKNDLNEKALRNYNRSIFIFMIFPLMGLVWMIMEIISPSKGMEPAVIFFAIFILYFFYYPRGIWRTYYATYVKGKHTRGIVKKVTSLLAKTGIGGTCIYFDVLNSDTGAVHHVYTSNPPFCFSSPSYMPKSKDEIGYYLAENKKYFPVPAIPGYMEVNCLSLSKIRENI